MRNFEHVRMEADDEGFIDAGEFGFFVEAADMLNPRETRGVAACLALRLNSVADALAKLEEAGALRGLALTARSILHKAVIGEEVERG